MVRPRYEMIEQRDKLKENIAFQEKWRDAFSEDIKHARRAGKTDTRNFKMLIRGRNVRNKRLTNDRAKLKRVEAKLRHSRRGEKRRV